MKPTNTYSQVEAKTPIMLQYEEIKKQLPVDALLLFRLGDFYELFFEDAVKAAPIAKVAITRRGDAPMAGFPVHFVNHYLESLIRSGFKVAICDMLEIPQPGKLCKREVTHILSPSANIDEDGKFTGI